MPGSVPRGGRSAKLVGASEILSVLLWLRISHPRYSEWDLASGRPRMLRPGLSLASSSTSLFSPSFSLRSVTVARHPTASTQRRSHDDGAFEPDHGRAPAPGVAPAAGAGLGTSRRVWRGRGSGGGALSSRGVEAVAVGVDPQRAAVQAQQVSTAARSVHRWGLTMTPMGISSPRACDRCR